MQGNLTSGGGGRCVHCRKKTNVLKARKMKIQENAEKVEVQRDRFRGEPFYPQSGLPKKSPSPGEGQSGRLSGTRKRKKGGKVKFSLLSRDLKKANTI